jgi:hypothetical protein
MAATKTSGVLQASVSNAAAATPTSSTLDLTSAYGAIITAKITNATGPTVACGATLNVSPDGTTWYPWAAQTAGTATFAAGPPAVGVYPMTFEVPMHAIKAQVVFTGNTAQAVTVEAQYQMTTAI